MKQESEKYRKKSKMTRRDPKTGRFVSAKRVAPKAKKTTTKSPKKVAAKGKTKTTKKTK